MVQNELYQCSQEYSHIAGTNNSRRNILTNKPSGQGLSRADMGRLLHKAQQVGEGTEVG